MMRGPNASRYSAGPNVGVAIAAFLFVGACVAFVTLFIYIGTQRSSRPVVVAPDAPPADLARDMKELAQAAKAGRLSVGVDGVMRDAMAQVARAAEIMHALPSAEEWAAIDAIEGRWAVVNDLAGAPEPTLAASGAAVVGVLEASGAEVWGVGDEQSDLDTAASVRAHLGVATAADPGASARLRAWLDQPGNDFAGVVWLARDDGPSKRRAVVVARDERLAAPVRSVCEAAFGLPVAPPAVRAPASPRPR
ncbi:MAG: hypothetical protein IBJ10_05785 [Phycisphaerales bacterium]|nr:hypothetical protein [Phycisphaerales bacterium]